MNTKGIFNNVANFNFTSNIHNKGTKAPILTGINYKEADIQELNKYKQTDIYNAAKNGCLPRDMKNQLILRRIPRIEKNAENFVNKYPEFCKEDIIQDLIVLTAETADKYSYANTPFATTMENKEKAYFKQLLRSKAINDDLIDSSVSINNIEDDFKNEMNAIYYSSMVESVLDCLKPKQKDVIERLYGLNGRKEETTKEIAKDYNLGTAWIQAIKCNAYKSAIRPSSIKHIEDALKD